MRRRALLAASAASGGDVGGGFTADFYFDYCEDLGFYKYCERAPDALGVACYNEMVRLIDKYGVKDAVVEEIIVVENPRQYGFNVTVENEDVCQITKEWGNLFLGTNGGYLYTVVLSDGTLYREN